MTTPDDTSPAPPLKTHAFRDKAEADRHLIAARALERSSKEARAEIIKQANWDDAIKRVDAAMSGEIGTGTALMIGCLIVATVLADMPPRDRPTVMAAVIGLADHFANAPKEEEAGVAAAEHSAFA